MLEQSLAWKPVLFPTCAPGLFPGGVLTGHSGWGLAMGKSVPTRLGTRDMTQLAVSAPALVSGGWTGEWGGEG